MKEVKLTKEEWEIVIRGIHNLYQRYGGYLEDDEVYAYNTELDNVLYKVKEQLAE